MLLVWRWRGRQTEGWQRLRQRQALLLQALKWQHRRGQTLGQALLLMLLELPMLLGLQTLLACQTQTHHRRQTIHRLLGLQLRWRVLLLHRLV
jgi:hypothetical protein